MNRRDVLALPLLAPFAGMAFARQAQADPRPWLRSGPMLGYAETTEVAIWLQTTRHCRAQIRFWKPTQPTAARLSEPVETRADSDHIARFTLSRLDEGSRYDYEVYLDGIRVDRPYAQSFQTQKLWQYRTDPPPFRLVFGSCAFVNDAPFDRPGTPYGDKMEIFSAIAAAKPDLMLWLGDNTYLREGDFNSEAGFRYRYAHTRQLPEMQALLASTHHYATWDDHDYGPDNSDRVSGHRAASLRVFKDYWPHAQYGTTETPGVFQRFQWQDVEVLMLDDRYYRSPNNRRSDPARQMFGANQMEWLMDCLASSRAPFKLVATGNQMLNVPVFGESLSDFPAEQKRLFEFLQSEKIGGVVFLTGDRHHTELVRNTAVTGYPLYDFTSSPLTAGGSRIAEEANNPARVPGTWVTETRNFGMLEFAGPRKERVMTMRSFDFAGRELWKHTVTAAELMAGKKT